MIRTQIQAAAFIMSQTQLVSATINHEMLRTQIHAAAFIKLGARLLRRQLPELHEVKT